MKRSSSVLSTACLAVISSLGVLLPRAAVARSTTPTLVQGTAFGTGARVSTVTVPLTRPVAEGDLLVGWFGQYNAPEQVQVSDNVNGTWTRAPAAQTFLDDTGDIALYYRENSQAAPAGITITVSVSSTAYLQGAVADYSGVALAGSLDQIVSARVPDGTPGDTGATAAVDAGELVFAAVLTGNSPCSVTSGSSLSVRYAARVQTSNGSSYAEDITSSAAGGQHGTATFSCAADWSAVCAVFHPYPATAPEPPSTPTGLEATSVGFTLAEPVLAGDLLVGWFSQYNAAGQVHVSDNVNGPWTRSVSTTWSGTGDIALFYRENSAPAPSGLVVTVSASASAYLQEAFADFRHVATVGALDQAVVSQGVGAYASVEPTTPPTPTTPTTTTSTPAVPTTTTTTSTTTTSTTTTTVPAGACSSPTVIPAAGGTFTGTTSGASGLAGSCGSTATAPERVFQW